tara:strand:- start:2389 stop:2646 length:258 start_codon:yes stop_codon:yes gene_type:complete
MATILYTKVNGEIVQEFCDPIMVHELLKNGYATSEEALSKKESIDTNGSGKLSDAEIKAAAKEAGIRIGRKSIATLKKELGVEDA